MGCKLAGNAMRRVASAFALSASSKVPSGHTFDTRTLFHSASWGKPRFWDFHSISGMDIASFRLRFFHNAL
jgi:hypothetical protein